MWLNPLSKSIYNIAQNWISKLSTNIPMNNPNNKHGTLINNLQVAIYVY